MAKLKIILPITLYAFLILFVISTSAEQKKPITSWKDIVIGKTTEEEIIAGNPEGSVSLSVTELSKLVKDQTILRVLEYGSERSCAEEMKKKSEYDAWARRQARIEGSEALFEALEFLTPHPKSKLEDCFKPALLKNAPIDLRWDKLGRAKLYIYSNGIVQGWTMGYWFYDPNDLDSFYERLKYFPSKDEVLEIFEIELGKPKKILKPDSKRDVYIYLLGKRKLELELYYSSRPKVSYVDFGEQGLFDWSISNKELIDWFGNIAEQLSDVEHSQDKSMEKSTEQAK